MTYRVCVVSGWARRDFTAHGGASAQVADAYVYGDPLGTVAKAFTRTKRNTRKALQPAVDRDLRATVRADAEAWIAEQA